MLTTTTDRTPPPHARRWRDREPICGGHVALIALLWCLG